VNNGEGCCKLGGNAFTCMFQNDVPAPIGSSFSELIS
jgi:hypothetical protein